METSLKSGFAQIFSCCPKNLSCPKLGGGGCSLPRPPGAYAYELNDLERLVSICRGKITVERQWNILDVRSLFKELESNEWLGIDCLDTLKEILAQTEKIDLLKEVEEFEQRLSRELKFEMRKGINWQCRCFVSSNLLPTLFHVCLHYIYDHHF